MVKDISCNIENKRKKGGVAILISNKYTSGKMKITRGKEGSDILLLMGGKDMIKSSCLVPMDVTLFGSRISVGAINLRYGVCGLGRI